MTTEMKKEPLKLLTELMVDDKQVFNVKISGILSKLKQVLQSTQSINSHTVNASTCLMKQKGEVHTSAGMHSRTDCCYS